MSLSEKLYVVQWLIYNAHKLQKELETKIVQHKEKIKMYGFL